MERVELTFDLHPDLHLTTPRAHTPAGWLKAVALMIAAAWLGLWWENI